MVPSQIPASHLPRMTSATHNAAKEKTLLETEQELRALNNPSFNRIIDLFNELHDEINQISTNSNTTATNGPVLAAPTSPSSALSSCPFLSEKKNRATRIWQSIGDDLQTMGSGLKEALKLTQQMTRTSDDGYPEDSKSSAAAPSQQCLDHSYVEDDRRVPRTPKPHDGPHWPTVLWTAAITSVLTYTILKFGKP